VEVDGFPFVLPPGQFFVQLVLSWGHGSKLLKLFFLLSVFFPRLVAARGVFS